MQATASFKSPTGSFNKHILIYALPEDKKRSEPALVAVPNTTYALQLH